MSYPEIEALRTRIKRRAAIRQIAVDMLLFVILPLFVGFLIEGFLP